MNDLGITVDSKLTFQQHILSLMNPARSRCILFLKCFVSRDQFYNAPFFTFYDRPMLEYSSVILSSFTESSIAKLESAQRWFTKKVKGCQSLSYASRMKSLVQIWR